MHGEPETRQRSLPPSGDVFVDVETKNHESVSSPGDMKELFVIGVSSKPIDWKEREHCKPPSNAFPRRIRQRNDSAVACE